MATTKEMLRHASAHCGSPYPPRYRRGLWSPSHHDLPRYTLYCHLERALVSVGHDVQRGQPIAVLGLTGNTKGIAHVHWQLCTFRCASGNTAGDLWGNEDPLRVTDGCFDPTRVYPSNRLVLTYPISYGAIHATPGR